VQRGCKERLVEGFYSVQRGCKERLVGAHEAGELGGRLGGTGVASGASGTEPSLNTARQHQLLDVKLPLHVHAG
jgi:hypothetical protein